MSSAELIWLGTFYAELYAAMHSSICLSQSAKIVKYTGHSWFAKVNVYIFLIFSEVAILRF